MPRRAYAERTKVSAEKSRAEIENIIRRYGATAFVYGMQPAAAVVMFEMNDRRIQFTIDMTDLSEQDVRQRWRALALCIKAKLESIERGITVFDDEFMAHMVMPDGQSFGDWARPQIAQTYATGEMPPLLPGPSS